MCGVCAACCVCCVGYVCTVCVCGWVLMEHGEKEASRRHHPSLWRRQRRSTRVFRIGFFARLCSFSLRTGGASLLAGSCGRGLTADWATLLSLRSGIPTLCRMAIHTAPRAPLQRPGRLHKGAGVELHRHCVCECVCVRVCCDPSPQPWRVVASPVLPGRGGQAGGRPVGRAEGK